MLLLLLVVVMMMRMMVVVGVVIRGIIVHVYAVIDHRDPLKKRTC